MIYGFSAANWSRDVGNLNRSALTSRAIRKYLISESADQRPTTSSVAIKMHIFLTREFTPPFCIYILIILLAMQRNTYILVHIWELRIASIRWTPCERTPHEHLCKPDTSLKRKLFLGLLCIISYLKSS